MQSEFLNNLEIFKEVSVYVACLHLLMFTDYTLDNDVWYRTGWSIIAFASFNLTVNLVCTVVQAVWPLIPPLVRRWKRCTKYYFAKNVEKTPAEDIRKPSPIENFLEIYHSPEVA